MNERMKNFVLYVYTHEYIIILLIIQECFQPFNDKPLHSKMLSLNKSLISQFI